MNNLRKLNGITPSCGESTYIDEDCILVGDIQIGDNSSIWPLVAARGDVNYIRIGDRTNVQDGSVLHVTRFSSTHPEGFPLIIGDDVTIGHKAMLHGCTLGNRILVGMGAIILDGVVVQDDVMIAAGALVSPGKVLESGYLYRGSPAKPARRLSDAEILFLKQSAENYIITKDEYLNQM